MIFTLGFPDSSVGKESACKAGDPGWIPGLGGSAGEGMVASQVRLVVKNLPANAGDIRDASLIPELERSPGGEHGNQLSILAWRIPWTEEHGGI